MTEENTIYVGKKDVMSYVLAVMTQFNQGIAEVHLKARGRSISCAVDTTQIVKNRFISTLQIKDIKLTTEELTSDDGRTNRVSSMDITLTKG
ncbi:MAG: DNA-binding protein Alba [Candidatus Micrarchaeota archaeon]|nr:DNA-binding protein Alba [Candidatus Micrarchaeota archaeon]